MDSPRIEESERPVPRPPEALARQGSGPESAGQRPSPDARVEEWYADNPLRRWRFAHRADARELENAARVPRGSVEPWETGGAVPDARAMRRLARETGLRDLATQWAAWIAARPAAPHIHPHRPRRSDGDLPSTWVRYPWAMLAELVDEEIHRAQKIGREFSLVMIQPDHAELAAWDGPAEARALRAIAAIVESALRSADRLLSDGTGRFVLLLPRTTKLDATAVERRAVERLAQGPVSTELLGLDHLDWHAGAVSYPGDGPSAAVLLSRLRQAVSAPAGNSDSSAGSVAGSDSVIPADAGGAYVPRPQIVDRSRSAISAEQTPALTTARNSRS